VNGDLLDTRLRRLSQPPKNSSNFWHDELAGDTSDEPDRLGGHSGGDDNRKLREPPENQNGQDDL